MMTETSATDNPIVMEATDSIEENNSQSEPGVWEIVTGRKRHSEVERDPRQQKRPATTAPSTSTQNRFEVLSNDEETESNNATKKVNNDNPPPIFLNGVENYSALVEFLQSVCGETFKLKSTTKNICIYPDTPTAYRQLVSTLRTQGADFHTFQLTEDKCPRVVIKNLHYSTPKSVIVEGLKTYGYEATNVTNVISRYKKPLPMFFVDITKQTYNEKIFDIKGLFYTQVIIEEPRKKRMIPQCIRCQQYGHTKTYCNHTPRCVRCGQTHESTLCPKSRETPPKCANCLGEHPANYRGCQTLKDLRKLRSSRNQPHPRTEHSQPTAPPMGLQDFPALPQHHQLPPSHQSGPMSGLQQQGPPSSMPLSDRRPHQNVSMSGMSQGIAQPVNPVENVSPQIFSLLNGLNNLIQPLFNLLQQLAQVTQAFCPAYGP